MSTKNKIEDALGEASVLADALKFAAGGIMGFGYEFSQRAPSVFSLISEQINDRLNVARDLLDDMEDPHK